MEEKPYYFDHIIEKYICIQFQKTGYCPQMSACQYYHKKPNQKNIQNEKKIEKVQKIQKIQKIPDIKFKMFGSKSIPTKETLEMSFERFRKIKEIQQKQISFNRVNKNQIQGPARKKKNPLFTQLTKSNKLFDDQQQQFIFKAPLTKKYNPQLPCHYCKLSHPQENLFCNSFCGHYFCYFCITQYCQCNQCKIPFDKETSQVFFHLFCKSCEKQNSTINNQKLCSDCVFKQQKKIKIKKQQQEMIKKIKQNPMLCIICFVSKKQFCVFPCAHMLYCEICVEKVKKSQKCLFCNRGVHNIKKIFY